MLFWYVFKNRLRILESQISQNMLKLARLRFGFCNSKIDICHIIGLRNLIATKDINSFNTNTFSHTLEKFNLFVSVVVGERQHTSWTSWIIRSCQVVDERRTHFQLYCAATYPSTVVEQIPEKNMVVSSVLTRIPYGYGDSASNTASSTYNSL